MAPKDLASMLFLCFKGADLRQCETALHLAVSEVAALHPPLLPRWNVLNIRLRADHL